MPETLVTRFVVFISRIHDSHVFNVQIKIISLDVILISYNSSCYGFSLGTNYFKLTKAYFRCRAAMRHARTFLSWTAQIDK